MDAPGRLTGREGEWAGAIARGLRGRCPACGKGRVFRRFLKVADACEVCSTELHHHRADDLPPYIVIFIVAHLVGYGILASETHIENVPLWVQVTVWPAVTVILSLALIQPIKGAVVGLQYALGMHGFGAAQQNAASHEEEFGAERQSHPGRPPHGGGA